jgi:transcription initiation factor TFIIIB Brf1 subunit/transcription initiation factor TFIIB
MSHDDTFDIFDELDDITEEKKDHNHDQEKCDHKNVINESGSFLCSDCGVELSKVMSYEKDWRYYGNDDTRKNSDPNRCHIRKLEDKSIFKDVENLGFSDKIVNMANDIYIQVTNGKIYRGQSRKAIIFGCVFHSIKLNGKMYTCDHLRDIFKLDRKIILKGLKHVNLNAPKESQIRDKTSNSFELINECCQKFEMPMEQIKEVNELYEKLKNKSSMINRSRPQSVTSSLVYYYICKKRGFNNVNIKDFVKKVNLSELTINKIAKEIQTIFSDK